MDGNNQGAPSTAIINDIGHAKGVAPAEPPFAKGVPDLGTAEDSKSVYARSSGRHGIGVGDQMGLLERSRIIWLVVAACSVAAGCGDNTPGRVGPALPDAGVRDAGARDVGARDVGARDAGAGADGQGADAIADARGDQVEASDLAGDIASGDDADARPTGDGVDAHDAAETGDGAPDGDAAGSGDGASGDVANETATVVECAITGPDLTVMHPMLNGVPVAQGGDRASAAGDPYQAAFEVTTSVADNQIVELTVDDAASPTQVTTYTASVANGKAEFPGVTLPVDGVYDVAARCLAKDGTVGLSGPQQFPVDTTPPDLTVTEPQGGEFFSPSELTDGTFPVCGSTDSADAAGLDPALGPRSMNACFAAGGSPTCFAVPTTDTSGCLPVLCPGDAPFDVVVTLGDVAGNVTTTTISNVTCFSTLPSIRIVAPLSDTPPFTDLSKHLLDSSAPQAFRDNAAAPGAQTNVVVCANRAGTIQLFDGHKGDAMLTAAGAPVGTRTALASDGCPTGFLFAVTFAGVTLPDSTEAADTTLVAATELRADLVDLSATKNSSPLVDLWVDSVAPILLITAPADICNSYHQSNDIYTSTETVTSTAPDVDLSLTNNSSTENFDSETFTSLTFPAVVFTQGETFLQGTVRDAAGNVSLLQPNPCTVTVGPGPGP